MWVNEIWRFPVKSMAGEQQQSARLTPSGIEGDRVVQVQNAWEESPASRNANGQVDNSVSATW